MRGIVFMCLSVWLMVGCAGKKGDVIEILTQANEAIVKGCEKYPEAKVATELVKQYTDNKTDAKIDKASQQAAEICAIVQAQQSLKK